MEEDKARLSDYLGMLEKLDTVSLAAMEPEPTYVFKSVITQEVAYNLMLFAQRRELHRAVAEWYEHNFADDLSQFYPILAHHWSKAVGGQESVAVLKAVEYLQKSGEQVLRSSSLREARAFFEEALALAQESDEAGLSGLL